MPRRPRSAPSAARRTAWRLERLEDRTTPAPLVAVGAGPGGAPLVNVYDTVGTLVRSFLAYDPGFRGGVRVATGDVTGDGVADIVTAPGPGGGPDVRVFDGATGGVFVAVGNFQSIHNPPGARKEIITGAGAGGGPHVKRFNAQTGELLESFLAYDPGFRGGVTVAAALGTEFPPDIVTGAGAGGGPNVRVFSGIDGTLKQNFFPYAPGFTGGVFVAVERTGPGGRPVLITGAGAGGGPQVEVFDAFFGTLTLVQSYLAYDPGFLGGVRVAAADLNGDGTSDVVTSAGPGGGAHVKGFDGATGQVLRSFLAYDPGFTGGIFVGGSLF
jgi:hypothetical protein